MSLNKIFIVTALITTQTIHSSKIENPKNKIVGGVESDISLRPFVVSLQRSGGKHFCGGTLIAPNFVLSAAHCISKNSISSVKIVINSQTANGNDEESETKNIVNVIRHPKFKYVNSVPTYDYALIELDSPSTFMPVNFVKNPIIQNLEGEDTLVLGWGTTSESGRLSSTLMEVEVPLVSKKTCQRAYPDELDDSMICAGYAAGGKDSCQGDSGGPLLAYTDSNEEYLLGVVSWGEGCARPNLYGVYADVSKVTEWIETTISQ